MAKYANRLKRKRLMRNTKHKIKRVFNLVTTRATDKSGQLHDLIWKNIEQGLDCGYDVRYNIYDAKDYMPSLEAEYKDYFDRECSEDELLSIVEAIKMIYITKYDEDLQLNMDEEGEYFTIAFK